MMNSLTPPAANFSFTNRGSLDLPSLSETLAFRPPLRTVYFQPIRSTSAVTVTVRTRNRAQSGGWGSQINYGHVGDENEEEEEALVEDLRVPEQWMIPSKAEEESEWLRVTLHKWLDDEYCPEVTNIEISRVAARSFYNSLVGKDVDIGVILLRMAKDLESINYQESFHGAFSSANAAMELIMQRIEQTSSSL